MKFQDYPYRRPDMQNLRGRANRAILCMKRAKDYDAFRRAFFRVEKVQKTVTTMRALVEIRHSGDTRDAFYDGENEFFNEALPKITPVFTRFYQTLLDSPFKKDVEREFGRQIISLAEVRVKRFSKELIPLMIRENQLASEYQKIIAACSVEFMGEQRNLMGITKLMQSQDRAVRKAAFGAYAGFFESHEAEFDAIYDELVHVRDAMGKKLGYKNFIPLGYMNLSRTDYDDKDVAQFRKQVLRDLVPVCTRLRKEQAARIGVDQIKFYDEPVKFRDGNAMPIGSKEELVAKARDMYDELSPETSEYFRFMCEHELMDLETRPGKAAGGFETFMPDFGSPFIFSNFNGTSADVDVLTHEAGHAFQAYRAMHTQILPEYWEGTYEVCEIHSMSMEFFTYPWMGKFFDKGTEKYKLLHTAEALTFVPYGVLVDEFQHRVYENPDLTPAGRKALWRELEQKYLPSRDYDGQDIFERGAFFFKQLHIFMDPFYYIDYTLASMGAFEFYGKMLENRADAWHDYLTLCDLAGSRPYQALLKAANLKNPFREGSVRTAIAPLVREVCKD